MDEQQLEQQKAQCLFCQLISGEKPSLKVYEDNLVVALLDIAPANKGHVLLMPKEHYPIMPLVPENILAHLFKVAKGISQALLKSMLVSGTNIFVANGPVAGQQMPHFLIHIIPREKDDGVDVFSLPRISVPEESLMDMQRALAGNLHLKLQDKLAEQGLLEEANVSEDELISMIKQNPKLHEFLKANVDKLEMVLESNPQLQGMFKGKDMDKIKAAIIGDQEVAVGELLKGKKLEKKDEEKELLKEIEGEVNEDTEAEKKLKKKLSVKSETDIEHEKEIELKEIEEEKKDIEKEKKRKKKIEEEEEVDLDEITELLSGGKK